MFGPYSEGLDWVDSLDLLNDLGVLDAMMISHVLDHASSKVDSELA